MKKRLLLWSIAVVVLVVTFLLVSAQPTHEYIIQEDIGTTIHFIDGSVEEGDSGELVRDIKGTLSTKLFVDGSQVRYSVFEREFAVGVAEFSSAINLEDVGKIVEELEFTYGEVEFFNENIIGTVEGAGVLTVQDVEGNELVIWTSNNKVIIMSGALSAPSEKDEGKLISLYMNKHPSTLLLPVAVPPTHKYIIPQDIGTTIDFIEGSIEDRGELVRDIKGTLSTKLFVDGSQVRYSVFEREFAVGVAEFSSAINLEDVNKIFEELEFTYGRVGFFTENVIGTLEGAGLLFAQDVEGNELVIWSSNNKVIIMSGALSAPSEEDEGELLSLYMNKHPSSLVLPVSVSAWPMHRYIIPQDIGTTIHFIDGSVEEGDSGELVRDIKGTLSTKLFVDGSQVRYSVFEKEFAVGVAEFSSAINLEDVGKIVEELEFTYGEVEFFNENVIGTVGGAGVLTVQDVEGNELVIWTSNNKVIIMSGALSAPSEEDEEELLSLYTNEHPSSLVLPVSTPPTHRYIIPQDIGTTIHFIDGSIEEGDSGELVRDIKGTLSTKLFVDGSQARYSVFEKEFAVGVAEFSSAINLEDVNKIVEELEFTYGEVEFFNENIIGTVEGAGVLTVQDVEGNELAIWTSNNKVIIMSGALSAPSEEDEGELILLYMNKHPSSLGGEIRPSEETGPIEIPIEGQVCGGCELDEKCYPFGYRKGGRYCSDNNQFFGQLRGDAVCENNFECSSNLCIDDQCIEPGIFQRMLNWFRRLFG